MWIFILNELSVLIIHLQVQPTILNKVKSVQKVDPQLVKTMDKVRSGVGIRFSLYKDGSLRLGNHLCISNNLGLKMEILEEAHHSIYSVHPSNTKMYHDLKGYY